MGPTLEGPQVSSTLTDTLYEGEQMDRDLEAEPAKPSVLCLLGKSLVPRGMGTAARRPLPSHPDLSSRPPLHQTSQAALSPS